MKLKACLLTVLFLSCTQFAHATSATLTFTKLTGITGGSPAGTAIYRASLEGLGLSSIQSLTIEDNSSGLGGQGGQFSAFDLDGVKLSTTLIPDASLVNGILGVSVFDFTPAGTLFTPGAQRAPADPALFGTSGGNVDDLVATLGLFDGNSIAGPGAFGFISMGDNGKLTFNLTSEVSTTGLYLYIGEVGDNGEVASGNITVSDTRVRAPEMSSLALLCLAVPSMLALRRKAN